MKTLVISAMIVVAMSLTAQAQSRQIRIDTKTCSDIMPEYIRKKNSPAYTKALALQKAGKARARHLETIHEVEFLRGALRYAKCKGVN